MAFDVFISYSHKDRKFRDELATHLSNLRNQGVISDWYDGDIPPGTEWKPQIMGHLQTAQIILLLISADFMASKFCYSIELKEAIARHDVKQARVIPIVLRPTDWEGAPFAKLQMLPSDARPVSAWSNRDAAFKDVVAGIRQAIKDLNASTGAPQYSSNKTKGQKRDTEADMMAYEKPSTLYKRNPPHDYYDMRNKRGEQGVTADRSGIAARRAALCHD